MRWTAAFMIFCALATALCTPDADDNSANSAGGVHAFFGAPVDIPINREPQLGGSHAVEVSSIGIEPQETGTLTPIPTVAAVPVNIQFHTQNPADGTYHFGYDIGDRHGRSYREERRHVSGLVVGRYGFMDTSGRMHHFEYEADSRGYRAWARHLEVTTTTTAAPPTTPTTTTTEAPFRLSTKPVPIIGPIPKTWAQLFSSRKAAEAEEEDEEFPFI